MTEIITVTIPKGLRLKIDSARGDVPRSKFISKSLEQIFYKKERNQFEVDDTELERHPVNCDKCECHRKYGKALNNGVGPAFNAIGTVSFQEKAQNEHR